MQNDLIHEAGFVMVEEAKEAEQRAYQLGYQNGLADRISRSDSSPFGIAMVGILCFLAGVGLCSLIVLCRG